jgi:hypothetical protein
MDIRSLARNAARSEHLRNVRRRSRPAKGKRSWTPAEQETVKLLFPNRRSLEKALPDRTWIAICAHAGFLGLRKKQHRWLACDLSKLKRMWCAGATKNELCEALPRYSWNQIIAQVLARRFLRPKRPPTNTGHPVIDQIRQRARYLNLTMNDVDAMSGTKRYFNAAGWTKQRRPYLIAVAKAIVALDGEVTAVWH